MCSSFSSAPKALGVELQELKNLLHGSSNFFLHKFIKDIDKILEKNGKQCWVFVFDFKLTDFLLVPNVRMPEM
jgi:hypothetical protein